MIRECSLEEISDGRIYELNDMVKADTGRCEGCYKCCTGMGNSIILDPYDIWNIKEITGSSFQELLNMGNIELNLVDGLILPNLKMNDEDKCSFLDGNGRCSIHPSRPGICRIFPLGRVYDGEGFKYFLQKDQCVKDNRSKVKVKKWIDTDNLDGNQQFISQWHYFIRYVGDNMIRLRDTGKGDIINELAMYILNIFYVSDITVEDYDNKNNIYDILTEKISNAKVEIQKFI